MVVNTTTYTAQYYQPTTKVPKPSSMNSMTLIKSKVRAMENTNKKNMPKDMDELKKLQRRAYAVEFLNMFATNVIKTKTEYVKNKQISINTLNKGLEEIGTKTKNNKKSTKKDKTKSNKGTPAKKVKNTENIGEDTEHQSTTSKTLLKQQLKGGLKKLAEVIENEYASGHLDKEIVKKSSKHMPIE